MAAKEAYSSRMRAEAFRAASSAMRNSSENPVILPRLPEGANGCCESEGSSMDFGNLPRRPLPICCYCGQVRRADGRWQPADLSESAEVLLTHGICPTCYDTQVRPQLE